MRTVREVSELTGVSVRTLHHYDAIGLLKPTAVSPAGYRLYDDAALRRLQSILFFRTLQFPLKEIKAILDSPQYDPAEALAQQIRLLELQYEHIGALIAYAREIQAKGEIPMNFTAFDTSEIERYKAEAKARWGDTPAYREFAQKQQTNPGDADRAGPQMMELFAALGACRRLPPEAPPVQEKIRALQDFITRHYYTCTDEILRCLGQMYVQDERFTHSIDAAGGDGTAVFISKAIEVYCGE